VLLSLAGCHAHAETQWFTVTGNPRDASVDTVQVDPIATKTEGKLKTMNVRVSRAAQRFNWEKVPYRSYESRVVFDCRARKADYVLATFYPVPLWQGTPSQTTDYSGNPQPMLFRDAVPNPTNRIIRAACQVSQVTAE
jgi:hypothetical protein